MRRVPKTFGRHQPRPRSTDRQPAIGSSDAASKSKPPARPLCRAEEAGVAGHVRALETDIFACAQNPSQISERLRPARLEERRGSGATASGRQRHLPRPDGTNRWTADPAGDGPWDPAAERSWARVERVQRGGQPASCVP